MHTNSERAAISMWALAQLQAIVSLNLSVHSSGASKLIIWPADRSLYCPGEYFYPFVQLMGNALMGEKGI